MKSFVENENILSKYTDLSCITEMHKIELKKVRRTYTISEKLDVWIRYNGDNKLGILKLSREVEKINKLETA